MSDSTEPTEDGNTTDGNTPPPPPPPASSQSGETYTKADLDRIVKERLGKVKTDHAETLKGLLGERKPEEVQQILAAYDEQIERDKDAVTKAQEAQAAADARAAEAEARARAAELRYQLVQALTAPGVDADGNPLPRVPDDSLDAAMSIALPVALDSDDEDPVAAAVGLVREKAARLFVDSQSGPSSNGTGSGRPSPAPQRRHKEGEPVPPTAREATIQAYKERNKPRYASRSGS